MIVNQRNILLIGMPATGKSTYGKYIANSLAMDFLDTDDILESIAGQSCFEIITNEGKDKFAEYESQAIIAASKKENTVIATGGSAIYRQALIELTKQCLTVHLSARKNTLLKRIDLAPERGIFYPKEMGFDELYLERMPLYDRVAQINFSTESRAGNETQLTKQLVKLINEQEIQFNYDQKWMSRAIELAQKAVSLDEVPVGAVITLNNEVIGEGCNQTILDVDATSHAEIIAIKRACKSVNNHRLNKSTLYVTLEPCAMCAGAILQARIARVVYAATDTKAGAVDSLYSVLNDARLNHCCDVYSGLMADQSAKILRDFFRPKR